MELLVSTGVPPKEPLPFTIFREEREPTAQLPVVKDERELLILTQVLGSLYTEDSNGEKRKQPKPVWEIGQRIEITPREWDADTPMEPQPTEELPRTPGRISPNPESDPILEIKEEKDHNGRTISIK